MAQYEQTPLKADHLSQGDCVSCNHHISLVDGCVVADPGYVPLVIVLLAALFMSIMPLAG